MTLYVQFEGDGNDGSRLYCMRSGSMRCAVLSAGIMLVVCMTGWGRVPFRGESDVINLANNVRAPVSVSQGMRQPMSLPFEHSFHPHLHPRFSEAGQHSAHTDRGSSTLGKASAGTLTFEALGSELGSMPGMPGEIKVREAVQMVHSPHDFEQRLQESNLIMLAISTQFCGPCKLFAPVYERMAADYNGKAKFLKVEAFESDSTQELVDRFQVKSLPSFFLIRHGEVVARHVGADAERDLRSSLLEHVPYKARVQSL